LLTNHCCGRGKKKTDQQTTKRRILKYFLFVEKRSQKGEAQEVNKKRQKKKEITQGRKETKNTPRG